MYTITFSMKTLQDMKAHDLEGRQFYAAVLEPNAGVFTNHSYGDGSTPKIVCPYQVNDILIIQESWARSGTTYVYKTDGDVGYNFRPSTTMPDGAARMWGRIVSITPWVVTQEIIDKYLSFGVSADKYAGTAKVIDYYDNGNKLLSNIRNLHNKDVLGKLRQPFVSYSVAKITQHIYYHLHHAFEYQCKPRMINGQPYDGVLPGPTSIYAIAEALPDSEENDVHDYVLLGENESFSDPPPAGVPIDRDNGSWSFVSTFTPKTTSEELKNYTYVGLDKRSTLEHPRYVYLYKRKDSQGNDVYVPNYATYQTEIVDPSRNLFAWLISGYLCSRDGEIIGSYF